MEGRDVQKQIRPRDTRAIVICVAAYLASGIICPVAAQGFAPIPSCTSNLSSFAGIVCSGDSNTGRVMHCVLNEHFQAGMVCSEWNLISAGRCPQYLQQRNGINDFACIGNELCPRGQYRSYEVYKYPACLNKSLYITEPTTTPADTTEQPSSCIDCADGGSTGTTTPADTTEQPSSCIDCADGGSTGSTTGTDTTTKSTLPTDSTCGIISETSKQSMSHVVDVFITVIVLMTVFCLLLVWEYRTGKSLLGVICGCLKNGCRSHRTTHNEQVTQREAEQGMTNEEEDTDHNEEQV